jgi:transcriptional regulator with XRE-family HTH domain
MPQVSSTNAFESIIAGLQGAGLSRTDICRQTGLSQATIWRAVHGEMRAPAFETYQRLAHLAERLGVFEQRDRRF